MGKTELIEQFFRAYKLLKFEGIQPDLSKKRTFQEELEFQISQCCKRLAKYSGETLFQHLKLQTWSDFFEILLPFIKKSKVVLYFEEIQWLANYSDRFTAEIKPFWDDYLKHNNDLLLIFSGSAPSFITKQFLRDSALYNRSTTHIALDEFSIKNTKKFLAPLADQESLIAHLLIGGIPEYLRILKNSRSILQGLAEESFRKDGTFFNEYEKIFVSSMAKNKHYRKIIEILSQKSYLTREDILKGIGVKSNGSITAVLKDLEGCGFIASYTPLNDPSSSKLTRYCLRDAYLIFYYRFIHAHRNKILNTDLSKSWIDREKIQQTLGYAFERWCRFNPYHLAKCMQFDQINFESGAYFSRKLAKQGVQIDLLFKRADFRLVICEVKYSAPVSASNVSQKLKERINVLKERHSKEFKKYSFESALIVGEEISNLNKYSNYFDHVVDLKKILEV